MAEPGANAFYFSNISSSMWHLSERPLLLILSPSTGNSSHTTGTPGITILTPTFEATRAKLLNIPSASDVNFIQWPEDQSPFQVLAKNSRHGLKTIHVDEKMRAFVWAGLRDAFPDVDVKIASQSIKSLRESKSPAEIDLMRCANEVSIQIKADCV